MSSLRVLVVDDSVVVRRLVVQALEAEPGIEVVGTAANGRIALAKAAQLAPDAITMDVEMPEMDGIEAVRGLRAQGYRGPVVMFSTLTARGAEATLDALAAGATDYVTKPSMLGSMEAALAEVREQLGPRIRVLCRRVPAVPGAGVRPAGSGSGVVAPAGSGAPVAPVPPSGPEAGVAPSSPAGAVSSGTGGWASAGRSPARETVPSHASSRPSSSQPSALLPPAVHPVRAVVLGSSTGGPEALSRVLAALPAPLPVPLLLVQHMPAVFTSQLAARLDRVGPVSVVEAAHGDVLLPGRVYVAPGDHHLEVEVSAGGGRVAITDGPPENYCRPAVDVLFRSAVRAFGGQLLAVVLTGMGSDGRAGCEQVVRAGGSVIVQDEASSVVWGMPGAVATAGLAHQILPLDRIGAAIARLASVAPARSATATTPPATVTTATASTASAGAGVAP